jgi:hypothetical protein
MTFNKQFAPDATGLDDRIEQLVEAIAQLLEEQSRCDRGDIRLAFGGQPSNPCVRG